MDTGRLDGRPLPVGPLKEQFLFMIRAVPEGMPIRRRVLALETCDAFLDGVEEALSALPPEQLDLDARGRYGLERCGSARLAAEFRRATELSTAP
jgi:hypothetical protein